MNWSSGADISHTLAFQRSGRKDPQHRDFIACLEFGTAQAVLPRLQRQNSALYHVEPDFLEKLGDIGEREGRVQFIFLRFLHQRPTSRRPMPCVLASSDTASERISASVGL